MPARRRNTFRDPAILASVIGGVCAVAAAVVPPLLPSRSDPQPADAETTPAVPLQAVALQPAVAGRVKPNLTYGSWTLHSSRDDAGTEWNNSVLKFTSQEDTSDGARLVGFFEWRENGALVGREHVLANYVDETRQLFIEGQRIEQPPEGRLGVGSFSAALSEDARRLTNGTWGTTAGQEQGIPGGWEARR
jgi:hypothetical protein